MESNIIFLNYYLITLYTNGGIFISYNQDFKDIKNIYRAINQIKTFQLGVEAELGMKIEMFKYNKY